MKTVYQTQGTCAKAIELDVDEATGIVNSVHFVGGCAGNTTGISQLVRGMKAEEVISRLEGVRCGLKPTSCPDQLAKALREATGQRMAV